VTMWPDPNAIDVARAQINGLESEVQALRRRIAQLEAKYGRAVAALQSGVKCSVDSAFGPDYTLIKTSEVDAILADVSSAQALDAWRVQQEERAELEAVYQTAKTLVTWKDDLAYGLNKRRLIDALAKVDARRGGK